MLKTNHCKGYFGIRFSLKLNVIDQLFFFIAWFGKFSFSFACSICKTVHLFQNTLFDKKHLKNLLNFAKFSTMTLVCYCLLEEHNKKAK